MLDRLQQLEANYNALTAQLASPEVLGDSTRYQKLARQHAELQPVVQEYQCLRRLQRELAEARPMLQETDAELLIRIALLPLIAGLSYEIIRYSAKHSRSVFALLARPGLWLQRITTKEPSDDQLECSIRSLEEAMALERSQGGVAVIS